MDSDEVKPHKAHRFFNKLNEKRRSIKFSLSPFHKTPPPPAVEDKHIKELLRARSHSAPPLPNNLLTTDPNDENNTSPNLHQRQRQRSSTNVRDVSHQQQDLDSIWFDILTHWDEWQKETMRPQLVEIICKRGVTEARRAEVWQRMSKTIPGAHLIKCAKEMRSGAEHTCIYQRLLTLETPEHEAQIRADLHRTILGDHLGELSPSLREALYRVLKAYSLYDEGVGYCQGMSFVAGLLLLKLPEEEAFYVLARIMKGQGLRSFYTEDMIGAKLRMHQMTLLVRQLFPDMYNHLMALDVDVAMVTLPWFMTAFAYQLPMQVAMSLVDLVILEGIPAFFRIGLAILVIAENDIMCLDHRNVTDYFRVDLKNRILSCSADVMNTAFAVSVSTSQLSQMEEKYLKEKSTQTTTSPSSSTDSPDTNSPRHSLHTLLVDNYDLKAKLKQQHRDSEMWKKKYEEEMQAREKEVKELMAKLTELTLEVNSLQQDKIILTDQLSVSGQGENHMQRSLSQMIDCNVALTEELYELKRQFIATSS
eukprot:TRINITY_DN3948_c0_g1_i1.p1 TRINITY_DN3948_c0_g1~~TRINITY_DN3948_c0_g1_i1.p1  ORF type:complete len:534 (-),score=128.23 TRINITY_DN3948_c0_g1_i1:52-1653(-)